MIRPTPCPVGRRGGRSESARMEAISRSTSASSSTGSLVPERAEELYPVVAERDCARPRPWRRAVRRWAATVATPGRGQHAQVDDVGPLGRQPGRQCGLEQRARAARVAADDEGRRRQDPGRGPADGQGQLRRELFVCDTPDPIGAEACRRHPPTAWSTAEPCGPSSGRTSSTPSHGRRG